MDAIIRPLNVSSRIEGEEAEFNRLGASTGMASDTISLTLAPREVQGKKVRALRRQGIIPVHLYGPGVESRSLQCEFPVLVAVLDRAGANTPVAITVEGEQESQLAFTREIQWGPRRDDILHVDFLVAEASRPISAQVPVVLVGQSPGAIASGGTVVQQQRDVIVEALPMEVPREIEVDLAGLTDADGVIRAGDISLPANVVLLGDPEDVIARIEAQRAADEEREAPAETGQGD